VHISNTIVHILNHNQLACDGMKPESTAYSSVHKALNLLEAFIPLNEEISAVEMSKVVGLNRSTTSRLLATLRDRGYLDQNPSNKKFSLGFKIREINQSFENSFKGLLVDRAKPLMDDLRDRLTESIALIVPLEEGVLISHLSEGTGPLRLNSRIGSINPYNTGAGGKLLLAFSSPEFQNKILTSKLEQRTPNSLTDPQQLKDELLNIVKLGYAVDREENFLGIRGIAVPLFSSNKQVVASLLVAGSAHIVSKDRTTFFYEELRATAEKISALL